MLLLCLDTATPNVRVALGADGAVLGEVGLAHRPDRGRPRPRHAEQVAPAVEYLCRECGVTLDQLAAVAVGVGPGLFTGLRVGVASARALANVLRVPVVGLASLDLVAFPLRHTGRLVCVVTDARRREVYWSVYRPVPGGLQRATPYAVGPPADVVAELEARGGEAVVAGDGALVHAELFGRLDHVVAAGVEHAWPGAAAMVELATARVAREEFSPPGEVLPMYLRASDAELAAADRAGR